MVAKKGKEEGVNKAVVVVVVFLGDISEENKGVAYGVEKLGNAGSLYVGLLLAIVLL